jgi:hypothetical protein
MPLDCTTDLSDHVSRQHRAAVDGHVQHT